MDKQFLAQELNAPITKNHRDGLSNRPAQPVVTISLNEIVRSTINKPHHTKIMINKIFEREMIFKSVTWAAQKKKSVYSQ